MADLAPIITYKLVLSADELRLVSKALRGLLREKELAEALALQERIMRQRAANLRQAVEEAEKTVANIDAAHEETK